MTSKGITLSNEIKALYDYVNRDEYNLNVVEVMVDEILNYIKGLRPCEKVSGKYNSVICPKCYSANVKALYGTINLDGSGNLHHYICEDCHKEFEV